MDDDEATLRHELTVRIDRRREGLAAFLRRARPRRNRLTNISVIGSALAAVLTAGPAFGGAKFTTSVQGALALPSDSVVWRTLCLAAVVLSVASALSTNLANAHAVAANVTAAETCNTQLEGLQTALSFGHIPLDDAVRLYEQYVAKVAFVDGPGPS